MFLCFLNNNKVNAKCIIKNGYDLNNVLISGFYRLDGEHIYEDYLRYTGQRITLATVENLDNYDATYALALIYFPEDLQSKIIDLNNEINHGTKDNALKKLYKLAPLIRMQLQDL